MPTPAAPVMKPVLSGDCSEAWDELESSLQAALETYANVHRGSGHKSLISTWLYEQARQVVLETLSLPGGKYHVLFCSPHRAEMIGKQLDPARFTCLSSRSLGLPLGVRALVVERAAIRRGLRYETGGGTVRLLSEYWAIRTGLPQRAEAGTPPVINVIAFAKALQLTRKYGQAAFTAPPAARRDDPGSPEDIHALLYQDDLDGYSGEELLIRLRETMVGHRLPVPVENGVRRFTNLDHAASTPAFAPVWQTARHALRLTEDARPALVAEVKAIIARFLDAPLDDYEIIFTSNTTEAINLVAGALGISYGDGSRPVVLNSLLEHNSNELPWRSIKDVHGLVRLPIDDDGFIDLAVLEQHLRDYNQAGLHGGRRIGLVAMSGASNVVGTFNDLGQISRLAHQYGAALLVDAAQLVAHRTLDMQALGIDYLAFSAHKAYAPFGSGVLLARKHSLPLPPAVLAEVCSSGEENLAGIAALGKALVLLERVGLPVIESQERQLTSRLLRGMAAIPGVQTFGLRDPDSPRFSERGGTVTFSLQEAPHNLVAKELAELGGIGVRNGCFCAHLVVKRLIHITCRRLRPTALFMLLDPGHAVTLQTGLVRLSLGIENDEADIDTFLEVLDQISRRPRRRLDRLTAGYHGGTFLPRTRVQDEMEASAREVAERVY